MRPPPWKGKKSALRALAEERKQLGIVVGEVERVNRAADLLVRLSEGGFVPGNPRLAMLDDGVMPPP